MTHDKATVDQAIADVRGLLTLGERGKGFAALRVLADAVEERDRAIERLTFAAEHRWQDATAAHERAEAAEAERDRLARQVADLEAALRLIPGMWQRVVEEAALAAARSREQQEPS